MTPVDSADDFVLRFAAAAEGLVGRPFRLHGRDPQTGVDCIGVLAISLMRAGRSAVWPNGYALRQMCKTVPAEFVASVGFEPAAGPCRRADVLCVQTGPGQRHFVICVDRHHIVHAHAGLRRVVRGPLPDNWPCIGHWRPIPLRSIIG